MKIPKKIKLGGLDIEVIQNNKMAREHGASGACLYQAQQIILDHSILHQQATEQTYLHELVHYILFIMGEEELRQNEKFVDLFATFLYQALESSQYAKA